MSGGSGPGPARRRRLWFGVAAGVLTAAVALGIGQLVSGLGARQGAPAVAVGQAAIDLAPSGVKNFAISVFGADDKTVLLGGILVVLAIAAAGIGVLAMRRLEYGYAGLAVFTAIGLAAALTRPNASLGYAIPTIVGALAGAFALTRLIRAANETTGPDASLRSPPARTLSRPSGPEPTVEAGGTAAAASPAETWTYQPPSRAGRRQFLVASGTAAVAAAAAGFAGRELNARQSVTQARSAIRFPAPATPAPPLPSGTDFRLRGLSSFITPASTFYRVDTAIVLPEVAPHTWHLRIHGMVEREITITFAELLRRPLIEHYLTLTCVSNPVSGSYVGNAKWLGASLAALIREARPKAGASQLLCTSVDGFTSGTPIETVLDGREALLAVAMNGAALPVQHGFPARMVVPGLYGYVSATKWVTDIKVTTFEAENAYWVDRGWSQQAPIKTESRIDIPVGGATLSPGRTPVAGVAWAQHRGIDAVEVRVDQGRWNQAKLAAVPGIDTWRQWVWYWEATPGSHTIEARATDGTGHTQTAVQTATEPNGATGYPANAVTVRS